MKKITIFCLLLASFASVSQEKLMSKSGKISFEASVPTFEEVKATNNSVTFVLNTKTGEIASLALMKGFKFKIALMEEHFNENYVESDKYSKSTFRGKIENFDVSALTTTFKEYIIKGKLELHGKTREITITSKIKKTDSGLELASNFAINASDYAIEIPSVVKNKVSNKILVKLEATVK